MLFYVFNCLNKLVNYLLIFFIFVQDGPPPPKRNEYFWNSFIELILNNFKNIVK